MRTLNPNKYILSAYINGKGHHRNHMNHCDFLCDLSLEFNEWREVYGRCKGEDEKAVIVWAGPSQRAKIGALALCYGQESYLQIHHDNAAELHFTDGRPSRFIGTFQEVSKEVAEGLDYHTADVDFGAYYAAL